MPNTILQDQRSKELLNRVSKDISRLKDDVSTLFSHTGRHTIPESAGSLADYGRNRLNAGGAFAANQFRHIRENPGQSSAGILGGLVLLGAVGFGIYYLCKSDCRICRKEPTDHRDLDEQDQAGTELPPYIT